MWGWVLTLQSKILTFGYIDICHEYILNIFSYTQREEKRNKTVVWAIIKREISRDSGGEYVFTWNL